MHGESSNLYQRQKITWIANNWERDISNTTYSKIEKGEPKYSIF